MKIGGIMDNEKIKDVVINDDRKKSLAYRFTANPLPVVLKCGFMPKLIMIYENKELQKL